MFHYGTDPLLLQRIRAGSSMTELELLEHEIKSFQQSRQRQLMLTGERYFSGKQDILYRKRTAIGSGGDLVEISNLPNNRIVDNQYQKMVVQKNNYLLGKPISIQCDNDSYGKLLKQIFNKEFQRLIKNVGEDSLNGGIGWLFVTYDEEGALSFRRLKPYEVIPLWSDAEHTRLDCLIRLYEVIAYEGRTEKTIEKVEVYDKEGIRYFTLHNGRLMPESPYRSDYFAIGTQGYRWDRLPIIPFKYNNKEIPLIVKVKSLQDALNTVLSNFQNNMEEDPRNTILIIVNYDGENLGEFRRNLATYGAVKVTTVDGKEGDVRSLQIAVSAENYKAILELLKKAIIENAMGYDAKDDRLAGNPNQMNIQSMYSDIDLDANGMETEYQAAFSQLLWFVNCHLSNSGLGDFEGQEVNVIFNRDMLISEAEIIDNCNKSTDLSLETRLSNHPWVEDSATELVRIAKEQQQMVEQYGQAFTPKVEQNE